MATGISSSKQSNNRKLADSTPPPDPQRSIAVHLSENQVIEHQAGSPKRRRLDDLETPTTPRPLPPADMYSFGTTSQAPVDLTNDVPATSTPRARRVSSVNRSLQPSNPFVGARKITVRNLKSQNQETSNHTQYLKTTLEQLSTALNNIFKQQPPQSSNEELYRGVENVCKLGKAAELNDTLRSQCRAFLSTSVRDPLVQASERASKESTLSQVIQSWKQWTQQMLQIRQIFFYLDRSYLLQQKKDSIETFSINAFRSLVFGNPMLQPKIIDGACDLVTAERTGQSIDAPLFAAAIDLFKDIGVYTNTFEPRLLAFSQSYISQWSDQKNEDLELSEFVAAAVDFIELEMKRCDRFKLYSSTRREILALLETHLIERREADLVNSDAVADQLDAGNVSSLEQIYTLLQRRRLGSKLKVAFQQWIDDTGTEIVFDEKQQEQMVIRLLALKQRLDSLWRVTFHKDEVLGHTLRESFEGFINKSRKTDATWGTDNSKPGEMIAKYVDQLLRTGSKAIPTHLTGSTSQKSQGDDDVENEDVDMDEDSQVQNQLDQVLDLFRFVHGKAVFEAFYKRDLARRLLMERSASKDAEIAMLGRLKSECGSGFTQNLEQMFKDIELAKEEMAAYKARLEASERRHTVDLNVNILSASAWPPYPDVEVIIPREVSKAIESFEGVYSTKHTGRKLQWKHALAHCQLRARFPKGAKELVVSGFQAVVLLLFNSVADEEHLSYEQLKAESGLTEVELKRTLQSLACAKLRPLTKHPRGREVNDTDTFSINSGFTHERARVKINAIQLKETKEENKETHERVAADRQFETQAAIVRIMKSTKRIGHQQLIAETISATRKRGTLQPQDIKAQIERLIEKEYMEREENNMYSYLA